MEPITDAPADAPPPWAAQDAALKELARCAANADVAGVRALAPLALRDPRPHILGRVRDDSVSLQVRASIYVTLNGAVRVGDVAAVSYMIARGHDVTAEDPHHRLYPLNQAAHAGEPLLVLLFCHMGAFVDARSSLGTALELAIRRGDPGTVAALLSCGAWSDELCTPLKPHESANNKGLLEIAANSKRPTHSLLPLTATLAAAGAQFQLRPYLIEHLDVKRRARFAERATPPELRAFSLLCTVKIP